MQLNPRLLLPSVLLFVLLRIEPASSHAHTRDQDAPNAPHQHIKRSSSVELRTLGHLDSKALFTLGALAVLGGASFYLGKHQGYSAANADRYPAMGYGQYSPYGQYGMYGTGQYDLYSPRNHYANYYNTPYSGGIHAGFYAHPFTATATLGRRRRGADGTGGPLQHSIASQTFMAGGVDNHNSHDDHNKYIQYILQQQGIARNAQQSKLSNKETMLSEDPLTHNNRYQSPGSSKSGKIIFPDDEDEVSRKTRRRRRRRRRRSASMRGHTVESSPITVTDDYNSPDHLLTSYRPIQSSVNRMRFPESKELPLAYRGTTHRNRQDPRSRYQHLDCENVSARNTADHFGLLMLEGALAEDEAGCGLSLICQIGRTPMAALPPKAVGLRRILTGPKPRGLDVRLWGALTGSLLSGMGGGDCTLHNPQCPAPPRHLLRVFAQM